MSQPSLPPVKPTAWVVCLCADWCGTCRDYAAVFAEVFAGLAPGNRALRFAWLEVEEPSGPADGLDLETFPTLLLADAQGIRFFGPLVPHASTLARLLDAMASDSLPVLAPVAELTRLVQTLALSPQYWLHAHTPK